MKEVKMQKKYVTLLKDLDTAEIDAVIISTQTTADEIYDIIREAREAKEAVSDDAINFDDLREWLPDDCEIISASNLGEVIW